MNKAELREGLKRLEAHLEPYEMTSVFVEEGEQVVMDSLVLGLSVSDDLSLDVSCNYVEAQDYGGVLQFFGQLELDEMMKESPEAFTELNILRMINTLNRMIVVGQFLYMQDDKAPQNAIGLRYTMRTDLSSEDELEKCVDTIELLMDSYELLCSMLVLVFEGDTVQNAEEILTKLMTEE
ncbi:MAG: hypothetical protein HDR25_02865 [Lachnospiraceae bacterium]|nr:hypothetical protein [Lachnospiraceae bacterium]